MPQYGVRQYYGFTEDLWFLSGVTTVLLQKTWQVWFVNTPESVFMNKLDLIYMSHNNVYMRVRDYCTFRSGMSTGKSQLLSQNC